MMLVGAKKIHKFMLFYCLFVCTLDARAKENEQKFCCCVCGWLFVGGIGNERKAQENIVGCCFLIKGER